MPPCLLAEVCQSVSWTRVSIRSPGYGAETLVWLPAVISSLIQIRSLQTLKLVLDLGYLDGLDPDESLEDLFAGSVEEALDMLGGLNQSSIHKIDLHFECGQEHVNHKRELCAGCEARFLDMLAEALPEL